MAPSILTSMIEKPSFTTLVRSFAVGSASGLVATWIMVNAQAEFEDRFVPRPPPDQPAADPPPVRMAIKLTRMFAHRTLADENKAKGAAVVNYGFGALIAGGWAALCEVIPKASFARGAGFGLVLWLVGDETTAPLFGVADAPTKTPPRVQAIDAASHVLYGWSADVMRRYLQVVR